MKHLTCLSRHRTKRPVRKNIFTLLLSFATVITVALSAASAQSSSPTLVAYAGQNETVGPMWIAIEKRHVEKIRPRRSAGSIAQRIAQHNNLPIVVAI